MFGVPKCVLDVLMQEQQRSTYSLCLQKVVDSTAVTLELCSEKAMYFHQKVHLEHER